MMKKGVKMRYIVIFLGMLAIVFFGLGAANLNKEKKSQPKPNSSASTNQLILYYGQGCPHCARVEEFIEQNKVKEKIALEEKEVWYDSRNAKEMVERAKSCRISENELGVPFLWDGQHCLIGDTDIIAFLKKKMAEK